MDSELTMTNHVTRWLKRSRNDRRVTPRRLRFLLGCEPAQHSDLLNSRRNVSRRTRAGSPETRMDPISANGLGPLVHGRVKRASLPYAAYVSCSGVRLVDREVS